MGCFVVLQHPTVAIQLLPVRPQSKQLMTSDQDTKVVAEPQGQRVQEGKDSAHLVSRGRGQSWSGASLCSSSDHRCYVGFYKYHQSSNSGIS